MSLDSILNTIIPLAAIIFFGATIYKSMQEPIDKLFRWIKSMLQPPEEEVIDQYAIPEIIYN